jgi:hypothetical protein
MSESPSQTNIPLFAPETSNKSKYKTIIIIIITVLLLIMVSRIGFYTVQPIGALPEGITLIVWRISDEPIFNSPDAVCLKLQEGVSLLCRGLAMAQAPVDRIILRLPYMDWAYLKSTGGQAFDR